MNKKRCTAILLAAGSGRRMGGDVAKQYMQLGGRPLICHALRAVEESSIIDDCILVAGAADLSYVKEEIVERYGFTKVDAVTAGGAERYDSVYHALQIIKNGKLRIPNVDGCVFIHDGARPFLTEEILARTYDAVMQAHACAAGMPVKDTIKVVDEEGYTLRTPDRKYLWQMQTPQVFDTALIIEAYDRLMREQERLAAEGISITDDAGVVETLMKYPVRLVEGSYQNLKITTPEDLVIAEAFLSRG